MIQRRLILVLNNYPLVSKIVRALDAAGGRALLVGGGPRDLVLSRPVKDLDIEVHGLSLSRVEQILRTFGVVSTVGKSFGVLRIHGSDVDWSLPRVDSTGRKPLVSIDPLLSVREAFIRRDLTMNAMGIDLVTYEFIDPFGGLQDIHEGVLRVPNADFFVEDPLRFYRVMQFVGRFEMEPDEQLATLCRTMSIEQVSIERIEQEFEKLLLTSQRPSRGIRWLVTCGRLSEVLPELAALQGVCQSPEWHPEGDVFEHAMQALDAAAQLHYQDTYERLVCLYAALMHDIGKASTTECIDGVWRSYGHDRVGAELVPVVMKRITRKKELVKAIGVLVKFHMIPMQLVTSNAKAASYKRLARSLAPYATLHMLAQVCLADKRGRNRLSSEPLTGASEQIDIFMQRAAQAQVTRTVEPPLLQGRDLLGLVPAGPEMGAILRRAYELQLDENITDKETLKKRVLSGKI